MANTNIKSSIDMDKTVPWFIARVQSGKNILQTNIRVFVVKGVKSADGKYVMPPITADPSTLQFETFVTSKQTLLNNFPGSEAAQPEYAKNTKRDPNIRLEANQTTDPNNFQFKKPEWFIGKEINHSTKLGLRVYADVILKQQLKAKGKDYNKLTPELKEKFIKQITDNQERFRVKDISDDLSETGFDPTTPENYDRQGAAGARELISKYGQLAEKNPNAAARFASNLRYYSVTAKLAKRSAIGDIGSRWFAQVIKSELVNPQNPVSPVAERDDEGKMAAPPAAGTWVGVFVALAEKPAEGQTVTVPFIRGTLSNSKQHVVQVDERYARGPSGRASRSGQPAEIDFGDDLNDSQFDISDMVNDLESDDTNDLASLNRRNPDDDDDVNGSVAEFSSAKPGKTAAIKSAAVNPIYFNPDFLANIPEDSEPGSKEIMSKFDSSIVPDDLFDE